MCFSRPSISVVTVVKNAAATIKDCIESVQRQDYPAEHIFVDGGSQDGTLAVIRACTSASAKIISEPDQGIYDAVNKGLKLVEGDVVGILNGDDYYAHSKVLSNVADVFENPAIQSCYGDLVYMDPADTRRVKRHWRAQQCSKGLLYRGWMPPHPTFFVRRSVYEKFGGYRTDLGTAADHELTLRFLLKNEITTWYIPDVMVVMRAGGASNATLINRLKVILWVRQAWKINGLKPSPWIYVARLMSKIPQYGSAETSKLLEKTQLPPK